MQIPESHPWQCSRSAETSGAHAHLACQGCSPWALKGGWPRSPWGYLVVRQSAGSPACPRRCLQCWPLTSMPWQHVPSGLPPSSRNHSTLEAITWLGLALFSPAACSKYARLASDIDAIAAFHWACSLSCSNDMSPHDQLASMTAAIMFGAAARLAHVTQWGTVLSQELRSACQSHQTAPAELLWWMQLSVHLQIVKACAKLEPICLH